MMEQRSHRCQAVEGKVGEAMDARVVGPPSGDEWLLGDGGQESLIAISESSKSRTKKLTS